MRHLRFGRPKGGGRIKREDRRLIASVPFLALSGTRPRRWSIRSMRYNISCNVWFVVCVFGLHTYRAAFKPFHPPSAAHMPSFSRTAYNSTSIVFQTAIRFSERPWCCTPAEPVTHAGMLPAISTRRLIDEERLYRVGSCGVILLWGPFVVNRTHARRRSLVKRGAFLTPKRACLLPKLRRVFLFFWRRPHDYVPYPAPAAPLAVPP